MKKKYTFLLILLIFIINSERYSQVWLSSYNGPANGDDKCAAIKVDAAGNVYVTGYSTGIGTSKDITTIKYNSAGAQQWAVRYNGPGNGPDEAYAITIDASGNIYITGYCTGVNSSRDIITIKYNNSGVQQWLATHTSPGYYPDEAYAITIDASGNTYVCGYRYDHDYDNEIVVIKYNSVGGQQWIRDYNGTNNGNEDEAYAITIDAGGNIYVAGSSESSSGDATSANKDFVTIKYSSTGTQQWVQRYNYSPANENDEAYAITVDASGNSYVTGYSTSATKGKDYLTIKYNSSGAQQWLARYNNTSADDDDISRSIVLTNNNDVVVTGSSKSSSNTDKEDYLTIKYNSANGSEIFTARYNDTAANSKDIAYSVNVTASNSAIYVTGSSRQTVSAGSEDIVTIEYGPSGSFRKKYRIVNPGTDAANGVVADGNNNFYLSGYLSGGSAGNNMSAAKYNDAQVVVIANTETGIPSDFRLMQNYPNPFNPSTNIKFDVKEAAMIKITIYDILGKELFVPVNEYLKAGAYEVSVNMANLSSGLYYYKMQAGSFTDTKKMMIVK